jgi:hypothetical protein
LTNLGKLRFFANESFQPTFEMRLRRESVRLASIADGMGEDEIVSKVIVGRRQRYINMLG